MYVILELQTNNGQTAVVTPIQTAQTQNEAMGKWHSILAAAAISSVKCHTAVILNERGDYIAKEAYEHPEE